ncbi:MAG: cytochrome b N-terminal domain-containing protein [Candidatus Baltobacteraceae bacterium]
MSVLTWIEQRTGLVSQVNEFLTEDVPGGASYWYIFGSATIFAMILQIVTGIFLTFYYAPSSASAWESTDYIYKHVPLGAFVLSLHFWGSTAMIALLFMHLLQTLLWGAYKAPREIMWVLGVLMLIFTLVLGLTGYLLPWDMNAYFASQVAINIASSVPLIGNATQQFLSGGAGIGTLTINRFFGLHVWLMPALLVVLAVGHLVIFRHNGSAGPPVDVDLKKLPQGRFWPNQMFMDAVASFVVFGIMVALSIFAPPPLDVKADPTQKFIAYPAWYFLALYGLLRVAGQAPAAILPIANLLATVLVPGVLVLVLILLPWLDRNPSRQITRRPWVLGATALVAVVAIGLSVYSQLAIQIEQTENPAAPAAAAAAVPAAGGGASAAATAGAKVYAQSCAGCHQATGLGTPGVFPPLAGNTFVTGDSKQVVHAVLYGLTGAIKVDGKPFNGVMPPWKGQLSNADVANVVSYIRSAWGNKAGEVSTDDVAKVAK